MASLSDRRRSIIEEAVMLSRDFPLDFVDGEAGGAYVQANLWRVQLPQAGLVSSH